MSAKLTLVVHSRRTDEADGDSSIGARAFRLRREGTTSACKGTGGSNRGGTGIQDAKRETQLRDRHGNGQGCEDPGDRCGFRYSDSGPERLTFRRKARDERGSTQTRDHYAAARDEAEANAGGRNSWGGKQNERGRVPGGKWKKGWSGRPS